MDNLRSLLAQVVLEKINEIEEESNLHYLVNFPSKDIRMEAIIIKEKIQQIKNVLESFVIEY